MAQSLHGPDDVYTSAVDEEVVRKLPTYPYAYEYENEIGPTSAPARAQAWTDTATAAARQSQRQRETTRTTHIKRNWEHDRDRNRNHNSGSDNDNIMTEKTRTGFKTTSNASPIRTINHTSATRNTTFNRNLSSADAGPESQAMQTYSKHQVSTTMDGAGEIQARHEVSTQEFGPDHLHTSNSGLKLRLDLNLDVEVELKAKIHGDLTLGLLK
ncbi:hypothetical protein BDV11DRAFT_200800 [Aspergillus similis]